MTILSAVGVAGLYYIIAERSQIGAVAVMLVVTLLSLYFGVIYYWYVDALFQKKFDNASNAAFFEAAHMMQSDSSSSGCMAFSAFFRPQLSWYSKCFVDKIVDNRRLTRDLSNHPGMTYYSLVATGLSSQPQITPTNAAMFGVVLTELYRNSNYSVGDIVLYKMTLIGTSTSTSPPSQSSIDQSSIE
jgi:hypothetical protein